MRTMHTIALTLVIIGALNWGLVGLFDFNLVSVIFGEMTAFTRIVYILVGFAAVYEIFAAPSLVRGRTTTA